MCDYAFIWAGICARKAAKARACFSVFSLICAGWVCAACHTGSTGQLQDFNADSPNHHFSQHICPIFFIQYLKVSFILQFSYLIRLHTFIKLTVHNCLGSPNYSRLCIKVSCTDASKLRVNASTLFLQFTNFFQKYWTK